MFNKLGEFVGKKPFTIVSSIIVVTLLFASILPSMESGTGTEDFLPKDNEIVRAIKKVNNYFGGTANVDMILVESENDILLPLSLKEMYRISSYLNLTDGIENVFGVCNLVEYACYMEYYKGLLECTDEELEILIKDVFYNESRVQLSRDFNDEVKGYLDINSVWVENRGNSLIFFIKVRDLSGIEKDRLKPLEWDVCFFNALAPVEEMKMDYMVGARYEPKVRWVIGEGVLENIKNIAAGRDFEKKVYIWIKPKNFSTYFPVELRESIFSFDFRNNTVILNLSKRELGMFGVAPEFNNTKLPARLTNIEIKTRLFNSLWLGFGIKGEVISKYLDWVDRIKWLGNFIEKRYGIKLEDLKKMTSQLNKNITFTKMDINENWLTIDESISSAYIFIKPDFMNDMAKSIESLVSEDEKKTLLIVTEKENADLDERKYIAKNLIQRVNEIDRRFKLEVTGDSVISYQIDTLTTESNRYILPGIFIAIILILLINFRRINFIFLPLICLSISVIWLFGSMVLMGIKFNAMDVALIPLIMGLGVDYSVHLLYNYRAEIYKGKTVFEAIKKSIKDVGNAMFLCTLTASLSFLSFLTSSIPPLRDFGILCSLGIFYSFVVTITFEAAVVYIVDRKRKKKVQRKENKINLASMMRTLSNSVINRWKPISISVIAITAIFAYSATELNYSFSMEELLPEEAPAIKVLEKVSSIFPYTSRSEEYILIEGNIGSIEVLEGIYETIGKMKDDDIIARYPDGNVKVSSILSFIENAVKENESLKERFNLDDRMIPRTTGDLRELLDFLYENYPDAKSVLHKGTYYDATLIRIPLVNERLTSGFAKRVHNEIVMDISDCGDAKATVTGYISLIYTITRSLTYSQIISTFICLIIAWVILIMVYRDLLLGSIGMIPVALSSVWILGSMYLLGYTLNVMTIMITSMTIGLGIAYAIHAIERFRITCKEISDVNKASVESFSHTGGAIFISALTTAAGFGILVLSPMPPEKQFGVITALTIIYAFLITLTVLPYLLVMWKKRNKK